MRFILQLMTLLTLAVMLGSCTIAVNPDRSGTIYIGDPVTSRGSDDQGVPLDPTKTFKTSDKKIYCTVTIQGPNGVRLGARWFYEDKLVHDVILDYGTHRIGVWSLEPPGGQFPAGQYRVEIYLLKDPIKVVTFEVIE